jgi:hypothetical protein
MLLLPGMSLYADTAPTSYRSAVSQQSIALTQGNEFPATFRAFNRLSGHTAAFAMPPPFAGGVYQKGNFPPTLVFSS